MGLIGTMRQRTQLLVSIIALALLFFIVRELFNYNAFTQRSEAVVGVVDGEKVTLQAFQGRLEEAKNYFAMRYQRIPSSEETRSLQKEVWQHCIDELIYPQWFKMLHLQVTEDELVDMVQGDHIHPDVQARFTDPETNTFVRKNLLTYLQNLSQAPMSQQLWWRRVEHQLVQGRCQEKLNQLLLKSVFINGLEANQQLITDSTHVTLAYLYIPYNSIPEDQVKVTDGMVKQYFDEHAREYPVPTQREIAYVTFPIKPSLDDEKDFHMELANLQQAFIKTPEDSLFASTHTEDDTNQVFFYSAENDLPQALDSLKHTLVKGKVIGPIVDKKVYKLYKVTSINLDKKKKKSYGLSVIQKNLTPSEQTKEARFKVAKSFLRKATNLRQFNAQVKQDSLSVHTAHISKDDAKVNRLRDARELVRWAYTTDKVGKVSDIFEIDNHYVVAVLTKKVKKGIDTLEHVRPLIKNKVLNMQKAAMITEKVKPLIHLSLDSLAVHYGTDARFIPSQSVNWRTPTLPGAGSVKKVIPQAFSLEKGKKSKIISEAMGIFVFEVLQTDRPTLSGSLEEIRKNMLQFEVFKQSYQIPKALRKLAHIENYSYQYY